MRASVPLVTRLLVILVGIALLPGCGKKTEPPPARGAEPKESCFETHDRASAGSRAVFERRHLQGGGPTWLAILDVLVKRRAEIVGPAPEPQPMVGATLVRHAGTQTDRKSVV